jgi:trk system potassium uptake protein TrkA
MKILIVGAGVVGESLAEQLSQEGHQVAVVDSDRKKLAMLNEKLDILTVHGNAGMPSVLAKAGIRSAEMVIAVTNVDEVNLVVGMMATKLNVTHRIARIRNQEYLETDCVLPLKELGIDHVINADPAIVDALVRMIEIPGSSDFATLAQGQVLMLGFDITEDSPAAGKSLAELGEMRDLDALLILYISRGDELIVPKGSDTIMPGDNVHILVSADTIQFVSPLIHRHQVTVNKVIIAGASRIGIQLAQAIQEKVGQVFLIEPDQEKAEEAANLLKKTVILQGHETDLDVLEEASIDMCDLFCAVSDYDQRNMLSALLAQKHSKTKTAVLVHQPKYVPVLDSLGIQIVINPRLVTVGEILMHVRRGHIHSVTKLAESRAEIIEMEAPEGSLVVKSKIKDLHFPKNALIGAVVRNDTVHIPGGNFQVLAGDTVVVFALPDAISRIEKLFSRKGR